MDWFFRNLLVLLPLVVWPTALLQGQDGGPKASITEEVRTLETYPFSEPNPIPMLFRDPRLYPYHAFEGYSATSQPMDWKVVMLENDHIEVFVLPEVGGKVWGAVVKETGHEFIYRNEVMKFRNIALRGPWTSGGIEFNFGVIGHTPATATPVDYTLKENPDGSVSCWVGSMDLPSRTHWRVEIRLPADRAYFETNVFWYNPTPLEQPYYTWMTAAAFARDDLEMTMPGNAYLHHSGEAETWPYDDEGRFLPLYRNNTFEGHKSYHVVGELNDFFGGYYHDDDYGFGHWARYEDMPGQKLWLWALSPEGGIWEELLTDTDGQYVEFQAGRQFVQYSPGAHLNPITKAGFDPMSSSRWTETWFPVEGIGGLTDADRDGAMFVNAEDGRLSVAVNAFREIQDTLKVWIDGQRVESRPVDLRVLEPYRATFAFEDGSGFRVQLPGLSLDYAEGTDARRSLTRSDDILDRPFERNLDEVPALPELDAKLFQAKELMKARYYQEAKRLLEEVMAAEPWNREALLGLAELAFRNGRADMTYRWAKKALQLDAYDAKANFLFGLAHLAGPQLGSFSLDEARDAFGWAARSMAYRSAANAKLAEIMIREEDWNEAIRYARLALDYDRHSVPAWRALAVSGRNAGIEHVAEEARTRLLAMDPLHHFVLAERYLEAASPSPEGVGAPESHLTGGTVEEAAQAFSESLGGEFPGQTLLELVIHYYSLELFEEALDLLTRFEKADPTPAIHQAWEYWLDGAINTVTDESILADPATPEFQFPFRPETYTALANAAGKTDDWYWDYLLMLGAWASLQQGVATSFAIIDQDPEFAPYHIARGAVLAETRGRDPEADFRRALELEPDNRIYHVHLVRHLQEKGDWAAALEVGSEARARFPDDFNLDLFMVRSLLNLDRPRDAIDILNATHVLPSENARESHRLWEQAHLMAAMDAYEEGDAQRALDHLALALEWPVFLGQGRPYEPEERLVQLMIGRTEAARGNRAAAREAFEAVVGATGSIDSPLRRLDLLAIEALRALGRNAEADAAEDSHEPALEALRTGLAGDVEGRLIARALAFGR
jgi:tetratricopeptide (TPR) repeat protein